MPFVSLVSCYILVLLLFGCSVVSDSFATPWTIALQACQSLGLSRQESWSGLPCLSPGDLPDPGIKPESLMSPVLAGGFSTTRATWEAHLLVQGSYIPYDFIISFISCQKLLFILYILSLISSSCLQREGSSSKQPSLPIAETRTLLFSSKYILNLFHAS